MTPLAQTICLVVRPFWKTHADNRAFLWIQAILEALNQWKWTPYAILILVSVLFQVTVGSLLASILIWMLCQEWRVKCCHLWRAVSHILGMAFDWEDNPAFSCESDSETLGWLNEIIKIVWTKCWRPFLRRDVAQKFHRQVILALRQRGWFRASEDLLRLTDLDPGEFAPILTFIRGGTSEINFMSDGFESLTLDLGLLCDLRPNVALHWGAHELLGLRSLKLGVPLRMRFAPMFRDLALCGQIECSSKANPRLEYAFSGLLGGLLNSLWVQRCVRLGVYLVGGIFIRQPRKVSFTIPGVKIFSDHVLTQDQPLALMRLSVLAATDLRGHQGGPVICPWVERTDPYCIVRLGTKISMTEKKQNTRHPQWNHVCEFPLSSHDVRQDREIRFVIRDFDWGCWKEDEELGFTTLSLKRVCESKGLDLEWLSLQDGNQGQIGVDIQLVPLVRVGFPDILADTERWEGIQQSIQTDSNLSQAVLVLTLYDVHLSNAFRPMVILQVSGRDATASSRGELADNWEFAEEFMLPIHDVLRDTLSISLVDFDASPSVVNRSKRVLRSLKSFLVEADDPRNRQKVCRDLHKIMGWRTFNIYEFTGRKEFITFDSQEGLYRCILKATLYAIEPKKLRIS